LGVVGSVFSFSRDMEREADTYGLNHVAKAGYQPKSFAGIWSQLRSEQDATAAERKQKSRKDKNGGFFATHPNTAERMTYLTKAAAEVKDGKDHVGAAEYRAAMADWWAPLIDDQIKLNDFGGTEFLLGNLAGEGWTSELLYARGELYRARGKEGDHKKAAGFYLDAIVRGSTLPEVRRGLGLALLRTGAETEGKAMLKEYLKLKPDAGDRAMMAMMAGGE
jgi:beta-barrel assembly-enhancing protease